MNRPEDNRSADKRSTSSSAEDIQAHLDSIKDELLHGKNSHEDPALPENWERLERGERGQGSDEPLQRVEPGLDVRETQGAESEQKDMKIRNAEAVGGQAPI